MEAPTSPSSLKPDFRFGFDVPQFSDHVLLLRDDADELAEHVAGEKPQPYRKLFVNSLLLAASSNFFKALFSNGMKETSTKEVCISVPRERESAFVDVVRCLYTGEFVTPPGRLLDVLAVADQYGVAPVVAEACARLERSGTTLEAAVDILEARDRIEHWPPCRELIERCCSVLLERFGELQSVMLDRHFHALPATALRSVLCRDDLVVDSENVVFQAIAQWAAANKYPPAVESLLAAVRWAHVDCNYLRDVVEHSKLYQAFPSIKESLHEAYRWKATPAMRAMRSKDPPQPRRFYRDASESAVVCRPRLVDVPTTAALRSDETWLRGYCYYVYMLKQDAGVVICTRINHDRMLFEPGPDGLFLLRSRKGAFAHGAELAPIFDAGRLRVEPSLVQLGLAKSKPPPLWEHVRTIPQAALERPGDAIVRDGRLHVEFHMTIHGQ